jgi:hypothetical protein
VRQNSNNASLDPSADRAPSDKLGIYGIPEFYYEASIVLGAEGSGQYRLVPRYLLYNVERSIFHSAEDLAIQIDIKTLDDNGAEKTISASVLTFPNLKQGATQSTAELSQRTTEWLPFIPAPRDVVDKKQKIYLEMETTLELAKARIAVLEQIGDGDSLADAKIIDDPQACYEAIKQRRRSLAMSLRDAKIMTTPSVIGAQDALDTMRDASKGFDNRIVTSEERLQYFTFLAANSAGPLPTEEFETLDDELTYLRNKIADLTDSLIGLVSSPINVLPVTFTVTVNAIKEENVYLTSIATAMGANKEKVLQAAEPYLDPAVRQSNQASLKRDALAADLQVDIEAASLKVIDRRSDA